MKQKVSIFLMFLLTIYAPVLLSKAEIETDGVSNSEVTEENIAVDEPSNVLQSTGEEKLIEEDTNEEPKNDELMDEGAPTESKEMEEFFDEEQKENIDNEEDEELGNSDNKPSEAEQNEDESSKENNSPLLDERELDNNTTETANESEVLIPEENEENENELLERKNKLLTNKSVIETIYKYQSLSVKKLADTGDSVHLSLEFEGNEKIKDGKVYITFKIPEEINLSGDNLVIESIDYDITEEVRVLILPIPIPDNGKFTENQIHIDYDMNTISISYEMDRGVIESVLDNLGLLGKIVLERKNEVHKFTLNIVLKNEAFSEEGNNSYTFKATGTGEEILTFDYINDFKQDTISLNIQEIGDLILKSVPETLQFQTTEIGTQEYILLEERQDYKIGIQDTRIFSEGWSLTAQVRESSNTNDLTMPPLNIGVRDGSGTFYSMDESVTILESAHSHEIDLKELENGNNIVMAPNYSSVISGETYSTTIEWTLIDSVQ